MIIQNKEIIVILQLQEICFREDKFFANWKVHQIKIPSYPFEQDKYMFVDDEQMSNEEETEYILNIIDSEMNASISEPQYWNIVPKPSLK